MTMMLWNQLAAGLTLAAAVGLSTGCDDGAAGAATESSETTPSAEEGATGREEAAPATLTSEARSQVQRALGAYERIRADLVQDNADVAASARELAHAARTAADDAPAALSSKLQDVATEANELAESSGGDIAAIRTQFGELSRAVIGVLAAEESLAEGLQVFECGMAQGYGKWLQPGDEIANPYMGTRMPACGAASDLEPS